jgi:A/G-specific adenine glycosylase
MKFSNTLIHWYLQFKRDLPWRNTTNPYSIWLSEIILQQTRVNQGKPYYEAFITAFPTIVHLANADEQEVLKLWQGLGYYSRARNLHLTAKEIAFNRNGMFPQNYKELLKLKGVGTYTAAAIASFAYNEPVAVLDGNVFRVLSRYFNIQSDISNSKTKIEFQNLAQNLLPSKESYLFNQAIMEFGALQCVPKNPNCTVCVFSTTCAALQHKTVSKLPIKLKKTKITTKFYTYLLMKDKNKQFIVQQRTGKGIWENLYEFPFIETSIQNTTEELKKLIQEKTFFNQKPMEIIALNEKPILHKLSHQNLFIHFYLLTFNLELPDSKSLKSIRKLPFPIIIYNFMLLNDFFSE